MRNLSYFLLFISIITATNSLAQENFILNGNRSQPIKINEGINKPLHRNNINIVAKNTSGEWKVFKNWNEGRAVFAENDSIVWVGTPVGLIRWNINNGTYQTFDENNGLEFTWINSLVMDKTGNLWIAAQQGLAVYSNGTFTHYNHNNSNLPEASMEVVCVDSSNRIIVAFRSGVFFYDGGVVRYDGVKWEIWSSSSSNYRGPTYSMCVYKDTVWISGEELFILTEEKLEKAPGWTYGWCRSLVIDYQDCLWVETGRKTIKKTGSGWEVMIDRDLEGIGGLWFDIWDDPRGGLWLSGFGPYRLDFNLREQGIYCGTAINGICTIEGIPGQFYAHHALSPTLQFFASIGSREFDYQTIEGGLYFFNGSQWKIFRIPANSIVQNEIFGLGSNEDGFIFLSTPLYSQKTDGQNWQTIGGWVTGIRSWNLDFRFSPTGDLFTNHHQIYPVKDSYSGMVRGLDFDGYGNLWITTPISKYNYPTFSRVDLADKLFEITKPIRLQITDIVVDKTERVWTASSYGAVMFDRTDWHLYKPNNFILPNIGYDIIFTDSKNRIWFSSHGSPNYGFSMFDGLEWFTFYSPQRYSISYVYQFAEDNFGNVWLATGGGLLKYDGNNFILYDNDNSPLSTNYISAVTTDLRGNIWIGTKAGLYVYNPTSEVEIGPYSFNSPVDSLTIEPSGKFLKVKFNPVSSEFPVKYQLQRGRGKHKFWTIAESETYNNPPEVIEITDNSIIIGDYVYRIKEVTGNGTARLSEAIEFLGKSPGVTLLEFDNYIIANELYFRWKTSNESFIKRYEFWLSDSIGADFKLTHIIQPDSSDELIKQYEILGDALNNKSITKQYSLRVVYLDSSKAELKTVDITPSLPISFQVSQNFPNPFNSSTNFNISMPVPGILNIIVYDILGREVQSNQEYLGEGYNKLQINFSSLASGVYFYSIESLGNNVQGKFILLK